MFDTKEFFACVIGLIFCALTPLPLLLQIYNIIKKKSVEGISILTLVLSTFGSYTSLWNIRIMNDENLIKCRDSMLPTLFCVNTFLILIQV